MGWDIHFTNTRKIGEILQDKEFGIEFNDWRKIDASDDYCDAYIYTTDEDGNQSGLFVPSINEDNYKDEYLTYGFISYGSRLGEFLWKLYTKYNIWFADTALEDWMYLYDDCENEEEQEALWNFCYAAEMVHFFGENLPQDDKLRKILKETEPVRNRIYNRYKERYDAKHTEKPVEEKKAENVSQITTDDEYLPF